MFDIKCQGHVMTFMVRHRLQIKRCCVFRSCFCHVTTLLEPVMSLFGVYKMCYPFMEEQILMQEVR